MNFKTLDEYPSNMHAQLAKAIRLSLADNPPDRLSLSSMGMGRSIDIYLGRMHGDDVAVTLELSEDAVCWDDNGDSLYAEDEDGNGHSERYVEYMERKNFLACVDSMEDDDLLSCAYPYHDMFNVTGDWASDAILRASRFKNEYSTTAHAA